MSDDMSLYRTLTVTRAAEGLAVLALNRPERLNTLSRELRRELAAAVASLEADGSVRVLILTGNGRASGQGRDLEEWVGPGGPPAGAYEDDAIAALGQFSGPVIGAINGLAVTGGVELALACDLLIASTAARFSDSHAMVGLLPGWGGSVRMIRRIGLSRAKELALTGRPLGAEEALAWGLVNHLVAPDALMPMATELAMQMLAAVPATLAAYKRLLDDGAALPFDEALALERRVSMANNLQVDRAAIDARVQGVRMRNRRKPV